ncbi:PAS domain-containing protein [Streptomyces sp. NPDC058469]|uniref:hybrid sensor histidine kinase/response regulator n=1 Tax=Streptomyces sp. NPDC058469 TaxID=3346514 RepID=UPI003648937C
MSSRPSRGAARLAAILDALPDALVLVNANGTVVNANTIALEAFEAPGTALVGRGLLDLLPEFDSRLIPGSMRRPDSMDPRGRTKPTRMTARRTDGSEFPVEVTSANLEDGQQAYDGYGYTSDELLMLVVRDLSGTVDTEAELARSQRQTEMILRAAAEGVVGTDTDGRVVLVNPAAAQILGYRASDLGGKELHDLVLHSRADGSPFPYAESPLADTLRSGRKHRVRGQVLFAKNGDRVSVDLTTAPVRDGDQLVGAVMTFTDRRPYDSLAEEKDAADKQHRDQLERIDEEHASELTSLRQKHITELEELREQHEEELAANEERYAALGEREKDRFEELAGRHEQLLTLLGRSLRGPLDELRRELAALAADDAGQLWPEANQVLHHLSAGYSRITQLIDNVLGYQRLETGDGDITRTKVMLDAVVAAGVDGAVELIGPGRVQFAVHAPPIEAEVDPVLLATALAHLVADVAGVDATGNSPVSAGGYMDNTVVVAAAQRGEVVRIEVRGPYAGGDPVHEPIVRGIVRAHGGVLQTHDVPGMSGSAYVLEVPIGGGAGAVAAPAVTGGGAELALPEQASGNSGRRRARRSSVDAFLESEVPGSDDTGGSDGEAAVPTGRRRRRAGDESAAAVGEAGGDGASVGGASSGTGRRRGRAAEGAAGEMSDGDPEGVSGGVSEGAVMTAAEHAAGTAASGTGLGGTVSPRGVPLGGERQALPAALPASDTSGASGDPNDSGGEDGQPTGRRRRALAAAAERAAAQEAGARTVFALPPAEADRTPDASGAAAQAPGVPGVPVVPGQVPGGVPGGHPGDDGRHDAVPIDQSDDHTPPQPHPANAPTGRRRRAVAQPQPQQQPQAVESVPAGASVQAGVAAQGQGQAGAVVPAQGTAGQGQQAIPAQVGAGQQQGLGQQGVGGQPVAGQPGTAMRLAPAQNLPAQGQTPTGQPLPLPAEAVPGQGIPAQGHPGQPVSPQGIPGQGVQGQGVQGQGLPGQPVSPHGIPGQGIQGQGIPGQGVLGAPGQPIPPQGIPGQTAPAQGLPAQGAPGQPVPPHGIPGQVAPVQGQPGEPVPPQALPAAAPAPVPANGADTAVAPNAGPNPQPNLNPNTPAPGTPVAAQARAAQPLPAEAAAPIDPNSTQGRAISVRTLGQGVPFTRQAAQVQVPTATPTPPPHQPGGGGRRRKLGTRPEPAGAAEQGGQAHPQGEQAQPSMAGQSRLAQMTEGAGRSYAIGAPDENAAEGPEPLDGPGGAVEIADTPRPQPLDDELPPEPLDNPRRLLVWPAPDVTTTQALSDRGYRPVIVHSREEVDAQIAAFPAALFVDPLTGPITRTALQSLRQAAVAAEVPVLVTAGLGQATREAAYGADPAVLLKALAPRDSEQHPPRVLLIEEHAEIALALTATLERRGMQVARAASDADAVTLAGQLRPNLVVMDLLQVHKRRAGIVDWLRANGQLNRTPLVVYTAAVDQADLPRLASGETVLFLAERSTSTEVQSRIVDLLARIGTN